MHAAAFACKNAWYGYTCGGGLSVGSVESDHVSSRGSRCTYEMYVYAVGCKNVRCTVGGHISPALAAPRVHPLLLVHTGTSTHAQTHTHACMCTCWRRLMCTLSRSRSSAMNSAASLAPAARISSSVGHRTSVAKRTSASSQSSKRRWQRYAHGQGVRAGVGPIGWVGVCTCPCTCTCTGAYEHLLARRRWTRAYA